MWMRKIFGDFLRTFHDEHNSNVYEQRINEMCANNKRSLEVTFTHMSQKNPTLAIWIAEEPNLILPILNEVAFDVTQELFPSYSDIHDGIFIRIRDLPVEDKLRDLRKMHLNCLIKVKGVVVKRTSIFPELYKMYFRCTCGDLKGPIFHNSTKEPR